VRVATLVGVSAASYRPQMVWQHVCAHCGCSIATLYQVIDKVDRVDKIQEVYCRESRHRVSSAVGLCMEQKLGLELKAQQHGL
jgi:hypothetical protein